MSTINKTIRRLPGFRFETGTATREDVLPRMDIALFVGFAASGPIGIPVVIESGHQFTSIFGETFPLVWDKEKGKMISAYLAPSVRMFFRNGGKRCWVIRTARVEADSENPQNRAAYNHFPLSGIGSIRFDEQNALEIVPSFARARSKGSWSDDLRIATVTASDVFEFQGLVESGEEKVLRISTSASKSIDKGDLLRLTFPNSALTLMLAVDRIEKIEETSSPPVSSAIGNVQTEISSKRFVWLRELPSKNLPPPESVEISQWIRQTESGADKFTNSVLETNQALLSFDEVRDVSRNGGLKTRIHLEFSDLRFSKVPAEGNLLVTKYRDMTLVLQVEAIANSSVEGDKKTRLQCDGIFVGETVNSPNSNPVVERLNFEIWVKNGETQLSTLPDLAFDPSSERFWGKLPVDDELYDFPESGKASEIPWWTKTDKFAASPIAGIEADDGFYLPLFPKSLAQNYLGAVELAGTKLQRDGLEIFDDSLFLDEKLKNIGLNSLLTDAEFIRYLSPRPRRLWGIHSALVPEETTLTSAGSLPSDPKYSNFSLDEATIISVPDAVHRGWFRDEETGAILSPPKSFDAPLRPEWWRFQDCRNPQIIPVKEPLWGNFLDCELKIVNAPNNLRISDTGILSDKFTILWDIDDETEDPIFVLEESVLPTFDFPQIIYQNKRKQFEVSDHGSGVYYYRVRAELKGIVSDWSEGLAIKIPAAENWRAKLLDIIEPGNPENHYISDTLLAIQRATLRMCAARGDIFAILDLPEHFEKDEAVQHVAALKSQKGQGIALLNVESFSDDEKSALSFGAVYHPWLMNRDESFEEVRNIPPSGAVCGVFAKRSALRGAWVAPANENLQNVLGLAKEFRRESFLDFQDGFINLIRNEPTGFVVLDSDTLSDDFDLRQINVRRLLSLLRRLASKHGAEYVFEPNDERFRRSVQRGFNALLDKMFMRGAFAGFTPASSYQVVVSDKVNNFQSTDQGRFIVELRVAPSLPLKFVTVRLVNSGGRSTVSETV